MKSTTTHELNRDEVDQAIVDWLEKKGVLNDGIPKVTLSTRGYTTVTVIIDTQQQEEAPSDEPLSKSDTGNSGSQTDVFEDSDSDTAEDALLKEVEEAGADEDFEDSPPLAEDRIDLDAEAVSTIENSEFD